MSSQGPIAVDTTVQPAAPTKEEILAKNKESFEQFTASDKFKSTLYTTPLDLTENEQADMYDEVASLVKARETQPATPRTLEEVTEHLRKEFEAMALMPKAVVQGPAPAPARGWLPWGSSEPAKAEPTAHDKFSQRKEADAKSLAVKLATKKQGDILLNTPVNQDKVKADSGIAGSASYKNENGTASKFLARGTSAEAVQQEHVRNQMEASLLLGFNTIRKSMEETAAAKLMKVRNTHETAPPLKIRKR